MDDNITSNVLKFADDTAMFKRVNNDGDKQHLQNDLDKLVKLSEKWQMGDTILGTTVKEKDLGVTLCADMKVS